MNFEQLRDFMLQKHEAIVLIAAYVAKLHHGCTEVNCLCL